MGAWDRRSVLLGGVGLAGTASLLDCAKLPEDQPPTPPPAQEGLGGAEMSPAEIIPVLVAVASRLLPSDDLGPGVKEAGAELYFEKALADPRMKNIKSVATRGAVWINRAARKENNVSFMDLKPAQQDDLVGRLVQNKVRPSGFSPESFIRVVLALTLEAFLGDPKHGGNRGEVGWNFVGGIDWTGRKELKVLDDKPRQEGK